MSERTSLVEVIQALADPLRLALLQQLMAGPGTVSELVALSGASQPNVSNHLALLRARGLVRTTRQGRASVYELRDATVAQLVESLVVLAGNGIGISKTEGRTSAMLAAARTCYDHLAGRLGVTLFDALVARGALAGPPNPGQPVELGPEAHAVFGALGIDLAAVRRARRRFATGCLDWTERRPHLGGALGAAIWAASTQRGWVAREPGGRALVVTDAGRRGFQEWLRIDVGVECGWRAGHA
jgi:DNA-binding transcriptional ArsR family regulator